MFWYIYVRDALLMSGKTYYGSIQRSILCMNVYTTWKSVTSFVEKKNLHLCNWWELKNSVHYTTEKALKMHSVYIQCFKLPRTSPTKLNVLLSVYITFTCRHRVLNDLTSISDSNLSSFRSQTKLFCLIIVKIAFIFVQ